MNALPTLVDNFFPWLMHTSLEASVLALFVLGAQFFFRRWLPARWRYALWFLVVLRLVMPVLPQRPFNIHPFPRKVTASLSNQHLVKAFGAFQPSFADNGIDPRMTMPAQDVQVAQDRITLHKMLHSPRFYTSLWLIGAVGFALITLLKTLSFTLSLRRARSCQNNEILKIAHASIAELGLRRDVRILTTPLVSGPAMVGILRPALLLPEGLTETFSPDELRIVFLHEFAHLRRGDIILNALLVALQILHWFNPVLWFAFARMRHDRELATDSLVLSGTRASLKTLYGHTLLKLIEGFDSHVVSPRLVGIMETPKNIKDRLVRITQATPGAYRWSIFGMTLLLLIGVMALTRGIAESTPSPAAVIPTDIETTYSETLVTPKTADEFCKRAWFRLTEDGNDNRVGALEDSNRAIELDPNYAPGYHLRGLAKVQFHDWKGALADYDHAIKLDPKNHPYFYEARAMVKWDLKDLDGGLADFDRGVELAKQLDPKGYSSIYHNRGLTRADKGDLKGAIADLKQGIELSSNDYKDRNDMMRGDLVTLAGLYISTRQPQKAIAAALRAVRDDDPFFDKANIANGYLFDGHYEKAKAIYLEIKNQGPKEASEILDQLKSLQKQGLASPDIEKIEALLAAPTPVPASNQDKGASIETQDTPKTAAEFCKRGEDKAASPVSDYDGAIADFNHAIELDPKNSHAYSLRGIAKYQKKDFEGALADYNRAMELDPKNPDPYEGRGTLKWNQKDSDGALADFNRGVELAKQRDPKGYFSIYLNRGGLKGGRGDLKGAVADYKEAAELVPKDTGDYIEIESNILDHLAWGYILIQQPKEAIATALKTINLTDKYSLFGNTKLAHAYLIDGQYEKAKAIYIEIKNKNPEYVVQVLDQLKSMRKQGFTSPDMDKIEALLAAPSASPSSGESTGSKTTTPQPVPASADLGTVTNWYLAGTRLGADAIEALEKKVASEPDNLEARMEILGYYSRKQFLQASARAAMQPHILWIIRNMPDSAAAGEPATQLHKLFDPARYEEAGAAWNEQIAKHPDNVLILGNAAKFFLLNDRPLAEKLLQQAKALDPKNPVWAERLGQFFLLQAMSDSAKSGDQHKALASFEEALEGKKGEDRFYQLEATAKAALAAGDLTKAHTYAEELLGMAPEFKKNWNYGNAVYTANSVLGLIALSTNDVAAAKSYLLAAGDTPGSPQLNSFGPNLTLAKQLLDKGEKETVTAFLGKISKFWKGHEDKIKGWQETINQGQVPQFDTVF